MQQSIYCRGLTADAADPEKKEMHVLRRGLASALVYGYTWLYVERIWGGSYSQNVLKTMAKCMTNHFKIHPKSIKTHRKSIQSIKIHPKSTQNRYWRRACQKVAKSRAPHTIVLDPFGSHFHQKSKRLPKGSPNGGKSRKRGHQKIDAKIDVEKG